MVPLKFEKTECRYNPEAIADLVAGIEGVTFGFPMDIADFDLEKCLERGSGYWGIKYDGKSVGGRPNSPRNPHYTDQAAALAGHTFANGKRVVISQEVKDIVQALIDNPDPSDDDDLKARLENLDDAEVYYSPSVEASLGYVRVAAGSDHKVDGRQLPSDHLGVELPIPENLNFIGYSDRLSPNPPKG